MYQVQEYQGFHLSRKITDKKGIRMIIGIDIAKSQSIILARNMAVIIDIGFIVIIIEEKIGTKKGRRTNTGIEGLNETGTRIKTEIKAEKERSGEVMRTGIEIKIGTDIGIVKGAMMVWIREETEAKTKIRIGLKMKITTVTKRGARERARTSTERRFRKEKKT